MITTQPLFSASVPARPEQTIDPDKADKDWRASLPKEREDELIERMQAGDGAALVALEKAYRGMVSSIAGQYRHRSDIEELRDAGKLGLFEALAELRDQRGFWAQTDPPPKASTMASPKDTTSEKNLAGRARFHIKKAILDALGRNVRASAFTDAAQDSLVYKTASADTLSARMMEMLLSRIPQLSFIEEAVLTLHTGLASRHALNDAQIGRRLGNISKYVVRPFRIRLFEKLKAESVTELPTPPASAPESAHKFTGDKTLILDTLRQHWPVFTRRQKAVLKFLLWVDWTPEQMAHHFKTTPQQITRTLDNALDRLRRVTGISHSGENNIAEILATKLQEDGLDGITAGQVQTLNPAEQDVLEARLIHRMNPEETSLHLKLPLKAIEYYQTMAVNHLLAMSEPVTAASTFHVEHRGMNERLVRMKPKQRAALTLEWDKAMNHTTIGKQLGVTRKAAERRLTRGMERLRKLLAVPIQERTEAPQLLAALQCRGLPLLQEKHLGALSPRHRQVLELYFCRNYTHQQIGLMMGFSKNRAIHLKQAGLATLKRQMGHQGTKRNIKPFTDAQLVNRLVVMGFTGLTVQNLQAIRLTELQRQAIDLRLRRFSYGKIAELMGISVSPARLHVLKGLQEIRKGLLEKTTGTGRHSETLVTMLQKRGYPAITEAALACLTIPEREALTLHLVDRLSISETGQRSTKARGGGTGISKGAAQSRIDKGLAKLTPYAATTIS